MSHIARAFAVSLLLLHGASHTQDGGEVDVYVQLLGSLKYAETFRISMSKTCPRLPATADSKVLKLCSQVGFTPDKKIIKARMFASKFQSKRREKLLSFGLLRKARKSAAS
ncbi:hypothetical protein [Piscinibacter gummiphilus]|uniref:UrcA family protein n=1 Tax=Piscinibacter gummiphilus TaxID=946333 RepID=A0ABZ0CPJ2_9BURK|nr:hypothetical protein [Piscinibacter gummiphilus]WOB06916.1 hypothetical protein RXV79_18560 [Piscinibacter gummiphilus]